MNLAKLILLALIPMSALAGNPSFNDVTNQPTIFYPTVFGPTLKADSGTPLNLPDGGSYFVTGNNTFWDLEGTLTLNGSGTQIIFNKNLRVNAPFNIEGNGGLITNIYGANIFTNAGPSYAGFFGNDRYYHNVVNTNQATTASNYRTMSTTLAVATFGSLNTFKYCAPEAGTIVATAQNAEYYFAASTTISNSIATTYRGSDFTAWVSTTNIGIWWFTNQNPLAAGVNSGYGGVCTGNAGQTNFVFASTAFTMPAGTYGYWGFTGSVATLANVNLIITTQRNPQ